MLKTEKSRYLGNALTDRHEIRQGPQGDAKALNRICTGAMRPFIKLSRVIINTSVQCLFMQLAKRNCFLLFEQMHLKQFCTIRGKLTSRDGPSEMRENSSTENIMKCRGILYFE